MTSSKIAMSPRRRTYVRLLGEVRHALNAALAEEAVRRGLTRAEMARQLDRDKSFVTRKLDGRGNMTLETLADLAFALDRPVRVSLPARGETPGSNSSPGLTDLVLTDDAAWPDATEVTEVNITSTAA